MIFATPEERRAYVRGAWDAMAEHGVRDADVIFTVFGGLGVKGDELMMLSQELKCKGSEPLDLGLGPDKPVVHFIPGILGEEKK